MAGGRRSRRARREPHEGRSAAPKKTGSARWNPADRIAGRRLGNCSRKPWQPCGRWSHSGFCLPASGWPCSWSSSSWPGPASSRGRRGHGHAALGRDRRGDRPGKGSGAGRATTPALARRHESIANASGAGRILAFSAAVRNPGRSRSKNKSRFSRASTKKGAAPKGGAGSSAAGSGVSFREPCTSWTSAPRTGRRIRTWRRRPISRRGWS